MTTTFSSPIAAAPVDAVYVDDFFTSEVTDLIFKGNQKESQQDVPLARSWRYRDRNQPRQTRRSALRYASESQSYKDDTCSCNCFGLCCYFIPSFILNRWRKKPQLGFPMLTGAGRFFHLLIRERPLVAVCTWLFLFLCEALIVTFYIAQTTNLSTVSWVTYAEKEFSWVFYAHTVVSTILLSQLFFAYSVSIFTIVIVLATSCYQILIFFFAFFPGFGWVSRMYVPFFLRCWPMRQYFLFLLDSLAVVTPKNYRLGVIRQFAPQLTLFVIMTFTFGCIFHIHQVFRGYPLGLAESIYWIMMTTCTVGFGDIVAHGPDGRALAMIIICIFLSMMPTWIISVTSAARGLSEFPKYTGSKGHFFVYGYVRYEDAISMLDEVFTLYPTKTVCFCFTSFESDVLAIGHNPQYRRRSNFFVVKDLDKWTLMRLRVYEATAIILVPTKDGSPTAQDAEVMLWSVLFRRNAPYVPQYLRLRFGTYVRLLRERQSTLVYQDLRVIMANALLLPGIVPFLVNLIRTSSACGTSSPTLWDESEMDNWKGQYEYSRRNVFASCPVPWFFKHVQLLHIVRLMKLHDVLVVGVEEGSRKLMRLDMEYCLDMNDTLLVICERGSNSLQRALEALDPKCCNSTRFYPNDDKDYCAKTANSDGVVQSASTTCDSVVDHKKPLAKFDMLSMDILLNENLVFYPYHENFDLALLTRKTGHLFDERVNSVSEAVVARNEVVASSQAPEELMNQPNRINGEMELRLALLGQSFVNKSPRGVALDVLPLGASFELLEELLRCHQVLLAARGDKGKTYVERLEQQINDILDHVAEEYLHGTNNEEHVENFLFIDQVLSFFKPSTVSFYDEYLNEKVLRYELLQMMEAIHSFYTNSRLTLLTPEKFDVDFLRWWYSSFRFPLRHVRGMGLLDSHLDHAFQQAGGLSNLRGILLYCSQRGLREFADVPIITVKNNIQTLLEWAASRERRKICTEGKEVNKSTSHIAEQHVLVELQSFASCVFVTPYHTDLEWRRMGETQFQQSLAFMMGRCFSANMFDTIFIYAHDDSRILKFFEMVLCIKNHDESFDIGTWASTKRKSSTLFQLCGNQFLHFKIFGDAFFFLLLCRSWVTIGVFRRFPASEGLQGSPRYFITNPPLKMPLCVDDVMYALSTSTNDGEALYS